MKIIIYGKDNCINCDKTKLLCQMQSLDYQYHTVGSDISIEQLWNKVGQTVRSLPQIFLDRNGSAEYVGGYDDLRLALSGARA
ncbi:MAG: hypothetical protein KUL77_03335 [Thermomonas sp.]|jgi:glutaredoxin|uniref:glutaredoxin domain-containing protein n=1 Tax=Thermomonas sp. TaxID=1971895 RepID=UPI001ED5B943|nr:glutaredoxin domain-containing protein [Thermomonas sp.]MBV2208582.1 hypothetical protein [Thermomonas sp.]